MLPDFRNTTQYRYLRDLSSDEYPAALGAWFQQKTGSQLRLDNPKTICEKIQWLKIHDSTETKTRLTDKYAVREWISEKIGGEHLVPLLGVYDDYRDVDFRKLPERFVLKCTHGSDMNLIVTDKNQIDHSKYALEFDRCLATNYAFVNGLELQYRAIPPKIIVEQFVEMPSKVSDYKIWCFNGQPRFIQVISDRAGHNMKSSFFDTDWNDLRLQSHRIFDLVSPAHAGRPKHLDRMLELAQTLSSGFLLVRVDFMVAKDEQPLFGEMTFTPSSGLFDFTPKKYDRLLGDYLQLPNTTFSGE